MLLANRREANQKYDAKRSGTQARKDQLHEQYVKRKEGGGSPPDNQE